jgi:hypothetical protein
MAGDGPRSLQQARKWSGPAASSRPKSRLKRGRCGGPGTARGLTGLDQRPGKRPEHAFNTMFPREISSSVTFRTSSLNSARPLSLEIERREVFMTNLIEKDPTEFFSVVGAAYVPERRSESNRHLAEPQGDRRTDIKLSEFGAAALWLVFYGLIIGASLFSHAGADKLAAITSEAIK